MTDPVKPRSFRLIQVFNDVADDVDTMPWEAHEKGLQFRINEALRRFHTLCESEPGLFRHLGESNQ